MSGWSRSPARTQRIRWSSPSGWPHALRLSGRPAAVVSLHDYVRPASLRFEHGHRDDYSYRHGWFDYPALLREVVTALRERRQWLPRRGTRPPTVRRVHPSSRPARPGAPDRRPMLHGRGLDPDVVVQLTLSRGALERRTRPENLWTIDPLLAHDAAIDAPADIVVPLRPPRPPGDIGRAVKHDDGPHPIGHGPSWTEYQALGRRPQFSRPSYSGKSCASLETRARSAGTSASAPWPARSR